MPRKGLSTWRYPVGLEPGRRPRREDRDEYQPLGVSRRFVAQTETALAKLLAADLSSLDQVALMVDGVHFGEHYCVVGLGIDIDAALHPLSLVEGSTENATLVTDLLVGLRERGLDVTKPILAVLGGPRRCAVRCSTCSTARCSVAANSTRSETCRIGYRRRCAARSRARCAGPTTPTPRWPPSSTAPTPARRPACARAWPRLSRCCG